VRPALKARPARQRNLPERNGLISDEQPLQLPLAPLKESKLGKKNTRESPEYGHRRVPEVVYEKQRPKTPKTYKSNPKPLSWAP
jgi:hypothetical protein